MNHPTKLLINVCPNCGSGLGVSVTFAFGEDIRCSCDSCGHLWEIENPTTVLEEEKSMFKFNNGATVRDRVTGFTGTITCRTEWLNKCIRYTVQPRMIMKPDETQKLPDNAAFDEEQLELVSDAVGFSDPIVDAANAVEARPEVRRTGGDRAAATRAPDPTR